MTQSLFPGTAAPGIAGAPAAGSTGSAAGTATIGASIGAVMPYVAAAYAVATIGFGIGNKREDVGGNRLVGSFNRDGFSGERQQDWKLNNGLIGGTSRGTVTSNISRAESALFRKQVADIQFAFNELGDAMGYSVVRTKEWTVKINSAGDIVGKLADGIGEALVPSLMKFQTLGENLAKTAVRLTNAFQTTAEFISSLGLTSEEAFGSLGIASLESRNKLISAAGGIEKFSKNSQSFIDNFLTDADKLKPSLDAVGRAFSQLGIEGVSTNEQFAALVKTQTDLGNFDTVAKLLSVADAFNAVTNAAKGLVSKGSFGSLSDYLIAAGKAGDASGSIDKTKKDADKIIPKEEDANASQNRKDVKENARLRLAELEAYIKLMRAERDGMKGGAARDVRSATISQLVAQAKKYRAHYESLPAFASGGAHMGGIRMVGERGPEIEVTGASRIISNKEIMARFGASSGNDALVAEIRLLRAEVSSLRMDNKAAQTSIAVNTNKAAKILERFDGNGLPPERSDR